MSALSIQPTYPIFTDIDGQPLEAGYVWIGTANLDPQTNPINVYWDAALTILAPQPIRTLAGYPSNNGTPARLYVNSDYSIRVMNKNGSVVYSAPEPTEAYGGGIINASQVVYDPAGLGAVTTTVQTKLRETVSVKDFGAVGDGVTNDRTAIQAALNTGKSVFFPSGTYLFNTSVNFTADNQCIFGFGNDSVLKSGAGSVYIDSNGFNNLSIRDLKIDASLGTNGGIRVISGSKNFDVLNVYFYKGAQRVWLWTCEYITVQNCTFEENLYGVISQFGFVSSYVLVDGNIAFNMTGDFVEANQGAGGPSKFWTISNNIFNGSTGFPTPATEERFVGITSVDGVVITGNTVRNSSGDSAVHLEDSLGDTVISNNIFQDCVPSGGNPGYIYLLNSAEDTVISNNIFLHGLDTVTASAVSTNSGAYVLNFIFTGNLIKGTGVVRNFSGCDTGGFNGRSVISNNIFENVKRAADCTNSNNVFFTSNTIKDADNGIARNVSASQSGGANWTVTNNTFSGIDSADITTSTNTNGTQPPTGWVVTGNRIEKRIQISDLGGGGSNSTQNIRITNNYLATGAVIQGSFGGATNQLIANNYQDGSILYQLRNFANDGAAAAGGIAIGGIYRNGSVVQVRVS
jgi:hypothetical protein